eukprot:NODE_5223_length_601_cov_414.739927.p4 GENE.NODE_5223_length_601_cov_414.739927~~NODE_5223_length_601_cov_414.739927.p4  ORF type:complete len:82 (-),score=6.75 NODE_5223_length_601_cov_414.739927:190-435(-)
MQSPRRDAAPTTAGEPKSLTDSLCARALESWPQRPQSTTEPCDVPPSMATGIGHRPVAVALEVPSLQFHTAGAGHLCVGMI